MCENRSIFGLCLAAAGLTLLVGCRSSTLVLSVGEAAGTDEPSPFHAGTYQSGGVADDVGNSDPAAGQEVATQDEPSPTVDQQDIPPDEIGTPLIDLTGDGGSSVDDPSSGGTGGTGGMCATFTANAVLSEQPVDGYLPTRQWSFAPDVPTLYAHIFLTGIESGAHELTWEFVTPAGFVYRRETLDVAIGEATGGVQGYPQNIVPATLVSEGWVASYALPVAESEIETAEQFGGWRLAVYLDEDPNPVISSWFAIEAP